MLGLLCDDFFTLLLLRFKNYHIFHSFDKYVTTQTFFYFIFIVGKVKATSYNSLSITCNKTVKLSNTILKRCVE